jgi:hypothetical protein
VAGLFKSSSELPKSEQDQEKLSLLRHFDELVRNEKDPGRIRLFDYWIGIMPLLPRSAFLEGMKAALRHCPRPKLSKGRPRGSRNKRRASADDAIHAEAFLNAKNGITVRQALDALLIERKYSEADRKRIRAQQRADDRRFEENAKEIMGMTPLKSTERRRKNILASQSYYYIRAL